tara:strand:+ start:44 stop:274 length:231 start_codon:yes stop_codon:yes gene_type:complete
MTQPKDIDLTNEITILFNFDHSVEVEYYDGYRTLVVSYDRFINDGFDYEDDPPLVQSSVIDDALDFEQLVLDWENA